MAEPKAKRVTKPKEVVAPDTVEQVVQPEAEKTAEVAVPEVKKPETKAETVTEGKVLSETKRQLEIHRPSFYQVRNAGAKIVVKNIGYGDAYVGEDAVKVGNLDQLISTGGEKVFEGVEVVQYDSASQPVLTFTEIG